MEDLSKTVSAGDLALATGTIELEMMNKVCQNAFNSFLTQNLPVTDSSRDSKFFLESFCRPGDRARLGKLWSSLKSFLGLTLVLILDPSL
jgi:hypothetical protein